MRIRAADGADAARWNAFVNLCPQANFYQRYEWAHVNREHLGHRTHFLLAERGDAVAGVLPLVRVRSLLFGDVLASMPFVNFGGAAGVDEATEDALVDAAREYAERFRCHYLQIRATRPYDDFQVTTDKVSMTVDLDPDPEALMRAFSTKHRTNIRRAQKNGITVRAGGAELLTDFYTTLSASWQYLGTPLYGLRYFQDIVRRFGDDVRIFVAYHEGVPVATAFNGQFRDTVEGMWAGVHPRFQGLQPNYVLYWEMIRDSCERGLKYFHLGRSTKDSGAARFKEKWTARPQQLYWNYSLVRAKELPGLNPDNPRYERAIRTWRRLPLGVLRLVGPPLARLIP
jgi:FemAB-related protein (PEP-CTERM system-associated)